EFLFYIRLVPDSFLRKSFQWFQPALLPLWLQFVNQKDWFGLMLRGFVRNYPVRKWIGSLCWLSVVALLLFDRLPVFQNGHKILVPKKLLSTQTADLFFLVTEVFLPVFGVCFFLYFADFPVIDHGVTG